MPAFQINYAVYRRTADDVQTATVARAQNACQSAVQQANDAFAASVQDGTANVARINAIKAAEAAKASALTAALTTKNRTIDLIPVIQDKMGIVLGSAYANADSATATGEALLAEMLDDKSDPPLSAVAGTLRAVQLS